MKAKIHIFHLIIATFILISCSTRPEKSTVDGKKSQDKCCEKDSVCKEEDLATQSEITCPKCGYKKVETLPTEVCVIKYNCKKCGHEMKPKEGDCCVYCTYGTHKCPSMQ